ncbi:hypothetical protein [Pseudomonas sp. LB3P14]
MTNLTVLSAAELARRKLYIFRESLQRKVIDAPIVDNLLPAIPGDDIEKLQSSRQGADCDVIITGVQTPPGATPGDTYIALMKDGLAITEYLELPMPPDDPYTMILPGKETATPGVFRLSYQTLYASNSVTSGESEFFIDPFAPNHGAPGAEPTPPPEVVNGVVTREILEALDGIKMTSDFPDDMKAGDIYTCYYGKSDPGAVVGIFTVTDDFTLPIEVTIPKNMVLSAGDGPFIAYFKYADRVGNIGPSSMPFNFSIRLTPAPSGLQPPEVPEHDDGLVNRKDAYPDVAVVIPTFDNGLPGDKVEVTFNSIPQPLIPTDGTAEVIVDVPFADVAAGGDGPKKVDVTYVIVRDKDRYPEPVGEKVDIDLNLAGPVNPEPDPDLGNPNLVKLVVKGSTADDTLVEGDVGTTVDIDLTIYAGYKAGDIVDLEWEKVIVPPPEGRYEVIGDEAVDFKIPFTLPSPVFEATGNGTRQARYVITNPPINGENRNPSPPTDVDVYIFPVTLPDPVLQNLYTNPAGRKYLDCSSLRDIPVVGKAAIVRVAGGGSLADAMVLDFVWSGVTGAPGSPPVSDYLFQKTLGNGEHINGFDVYLPFALALKPIKDGTGKIIYSTSINGKTHTSNFQEERVVMIDFNGGFCPGT